MQTVEPNSAFHMGEGGKSCMVVDRRLCAAKMHNFHGSLSPLPVMRACFMRLPGRKWARAQTVLVCAHEAPICPERNLRLGHVGSGGVVDGARSLRRLRTITQCFAHRTPTIWRLCNMRARQLSVSTRVTYSHMLLTGAITQSRGRHFAHVTFAPHDFQYECTP